MNKPKSYGSGHSTGKYFVIEARTTFPEPSVIHGMILTKEWRRVLTRNVPSSMLIAIGDAIAVPGESWNVQARELGFMTREAAYALAVRFQLGELCVQTRLVEVKLITSYETEEVGVCEPFSVSESLRFLKSTPRGDTEQTVGNDPVEPAEVTAP